MTGNGKQSDNERDSNTHITVGIRVPVGLHKKAGKVAAKRRSTKSEVYVKALRKDLAGERV